jgi:uncharacterized protein (DUF111 family)
MLGETASLGLRVHSIDRLERPRTIIEVPTRYGTVRVKVAAGDGLPPHFAPEFEDVRRLAREHGEPVKHVYEEALAALRNRSTE